MQRAAYLDACTRAIVSEPNTDEGVVFYFPNKRRTAPPRLVLPAAHDAALPQNTFTSAETVHLKNRACIVCASTDRVETLLANPFTVRCHVGICGACRAS